MSVASRKMTSYAKTDCVGASKGLFFGLLTLVSGVNFINVKHANFLYESLFGSFFYLNVTREKLPKRHSYKKFSRLMLMKLTAGLICLILFFVLIDHDNQQVNPEMKINHSSKSYRAFHRFRQAIYISWWWFGFRLNQIFNTALAASKKYSIQKWSKLIKK